MNVSRGISSHSGRWLPPGRERKDRMTFCLGITVEEGLVGIADTRVVAGNECLVARKTATYQGPGFSFFVLHSGLRSARDKILLYFEEAFARESKSRGRLFRVVNLYAQQVRRVSEEDGQALRNADLKFNAYSLIGGQMAARLGDQTAHGGVIVTGWPTVMIGDAPKGVG